MSDCTHCRVTAKDYQKRSNVWECSHVSCPMRRGATCTAGDHVAEQSYRGGTATELRGMSVGAAGCYRVTPTNKDIS